MIQVANLGAELDGQPAQGGPTAVWAIEGAWFQNSAVGLGLRI
jgi:hypothetical protein